VAADCLRSAQRCSGVRLPSARQQPVSWAPRSQLFGRGELQQIKSNVQQSDAWRSCCSWSSGVNIDVYIHVHIHVHLYTYLRDTFIYIFACLYTRVRMYMYMYEYTYTAVSCRGQVNAGDTEVHQLPRTENVYMYEYMYIAVHTERWTEQLTRTKREMLQHTHTFLRALPVFLSLLLYRARARSLSLFAMCVCVCVRVCVMRSWARRQREGG
jgi:hypothetical protein